MYANWENGKRILILWSRSLRIRMYDYRIMNVPLLELSFLLTDQCHKHSNNITVQLCYKLSTMHIRHKTRALYPQTHINTSLHTHVRAISSHESSETLTAKRFHLHKHIYYTIMCDLDVRWAWHEDVYFSVRLHVWMCDTDIMFCHKRAHCIRATYEPDVCSVCVAHVERYTYSPTL